jgi:DNA repair protein RadC
MPVMEAILLQYGLAGVAIISLARAVYILWKKVNDLQDARLNDLKEINAKTNTTLTDLKDLSQKIYKSLPKSKRDK